MTTEIKQRDSAFKSGIRDQWDQAAAGWSNYSPLIRKWLQLPTQAMLRMAGIGPGHKVLDVAAGAGEQSLEIAACVGPSGEVKATDISSQILSCARKNVQQAGVRNIAFLVADAEDLPLEPATFDSAVCRLGLMFLPNPRAGLSEIRRVLKPRARFCSMVFAAPDTNPCIRILMSTAMRHARSQPRDPFAPGSLFSLSKPGLIDALFADAGFSQVATTRMAVPFAANTTQEYLDFIRASAAPIAEILSPLDESARAATWADIAEQLEVYQTVDGWFGPNEMLLTAGEA